MDTRWLGQQGKGRTDGEKQDLKANLRPNNQLQGFREKRGRMEYKRRIRVTHTSSNVKRKRINGRGGAPALMHRPAAVEVAPSPEKRGECAYTASRSIHAAASAPVC